MSLTARQAFKFGFLLRCADENLTPEQTQQRVKTAESKLPITLRGVAESTKVLAGLAALGLLGAGGVGVASGHLVAKVTEPEFDPSTGVQSTGISRFQKRELIAAYRRQASRVRQLRKQRKYRESRTKKPPQSAVFF